MVAKQPRRSHVDRFKMHPKAAVNSPLQEVEKGARSALYLQELLYNRGFVYSAVDYSVRACVLNPKCLNVPRIRPLHYTSVAIGGQF
jgi:hypothetical protein